MKDEIEKKIKASKWLMDFYTMMGDREGFELAKKEWCKYIEERNNV